MVHPRRPICRAIPAIISAVAAASQCPAAFRHGPSVSFSTMYGRQRGRHAISCLGRGRRASDHSISQRMTMRGSQTFSYTTLDAIDGSSQSHKPNCLRDLKHVLQTIERAAYSAGEIALSTAGKIAIKSTKANARDLVTESDVECQQLIKEMILKEFPDDVFLGEEGIDLSGDSSAASSDALRDAMGIAGRSDSKDRLLFVVDPIDGTTNFQAGLPIYAMSIGVVSLSGSTPEVVAGVIYNPTLGEMTSAVRGRGCYLNNARIDPVPRNDDHREKPRQSILSQSLINVGFPVCKESTLLVSSRAVTALATKVRGLRMVACASQASECPRLCVSLLCTALTPLLH